LHLLIHFLGDQVGQATQLHQLAPRVLQRLDRPQDHLVLGHHSPHPCLPPLVGQDCPEYRLVLWHLVYLLVLHRQADQLVLMVLLDLKDHYHLLAQGVRDRQVLQLILLRFHLQDPAHLGHL